MIKWSDNENNRTVVVAVYSAAIKKVTEVKKKVTEVNPQMPRNLKLLAAGKLFGHLSDYMDFFSVEKEFPVTKELKEKLVKAGTNPYVILGMMPAAAKTSGAK